MSQGETLSIEHEGTLQSATVNVGSVCVLAVRLALGSGVSEAQPAQSKSSKAQVKDERSNKKTRTMSRKWSKRRVLAGKANRPLDRTKAKRQLKRMDALRTRLGATDGRQMKQPERRAPLGKTDRMDLINALRALEEELSKRIPGPQMHRGVSGEHIMNEILATLSTMAQIEASVRHQNGMVNTSERVHQANQRTTRSDFRALIAHLVMTIASGGETPAETQARIEAQAKFLAERKKKRGEKQKSVRRNLPNRNSAMTVDGLIFLGATQHKQIWPL